VKQIAEKPARRFANDHRVWLGNRITPLQCVVRYGARQCGLATKPMSLLRSKPRSPPVPRAPPARRHPHGPRGSQSMHARSSWFGIGALNSLPMSALGQKQTSAWRSLMSALPQKRTSMRLLLMSALCQKRKWTAPYSITSSAMESKPDGTSMPSARAVWRLMTNSNLVDCSTGRSAGLAPLRMPPVYRPT
jgi:hypothetical protein